jgi:hypothetical protein
MWRLVARTGEALRAGVGLGIVATCLVILGRSHGLVPAREPDERPL